MTKEASSAKHETAPRLLPREILLGVLLAGTSGAAILAHTFGPVPLSFTAPFVVLPTASVLVSLILLNQKLYHRLHAFSSRLMRGFAWGLAATLCYDAIRPLLKLIFGFAFDPYRAIPIFGQLITGLSATDPMSIAVGWLYHFWNGISFGMMFALLRPQGGSIAGLIWAMILQGLMMLAYPTLLQIRLEDPGFLAMGLVGHGLWGIILGAGLKRGARHA